MEMKEWHGRGGSTMEETWRSGRRRQNSEQENNASDTWAQQHADIQPRQTTNAQKLRNLETKASKHQSTDTVARQGIEGLEWAQEWEKQREDKLLCPEHSATGIQRCRHYGVHSNMYCEDKEFENFDCQLKISMKTNAISINKNKNFITPILNTDCTELTMSSYGLFSCKKCIDSKSNYEMEKKLSIKLQRLNNCNNNSCFDIQLPNNNVKNKITLSTPYHQLLENSSGQKNKKTRANINDPQTKPNVDKYSLFTLPSLQHCCLHTHLSLPTLRIFLFSFLLMSNSLLSVASASNTQSFLPLERVKHSIHDTSADTHHHLTNSADLNPTGTINQPYEPSHASAFASTKASPGGTSLSEPGQMNVRHPVLVQSVPLSRSEDIVHPSHYRSSRQYTELGSSDVSSNNSTHSSGGRSDRPPDSCEVSNIKCALRTGCGMALQKYMLDCADLINGHTSECEPHCKDSLLILTSTAEGMALMGCECSDEYCRHTKARMEVCREQVLHARSLNGEYSCTLAHLVCSADTSCSTAITYYDKFCRRMFNGRSCPPRCNNSIAILQRQEKAAKLETCICDGSEPFDCVTIKKNMAHLCFHQIDEKDREEQEEETNEIDTTPVKGSKADMSGAAAVALIFGGRWWILFGHPIIIINVLILMFISNR